MGEYNKTIWFFQTRILSTQLLKPNYFVGVGFRVKKTQHSHMVRT